jgi:putative inorganic carbon (HCO3(-)) transporter
VQACFSILFGISIGNAGNFFLFAYSTVLLLAALVILGIRHAGDLAVVVQAYLIGVAALIYQAVFAFHLEQGPGLARLSALFTFDANDVGLILVTALPIAVALGSVWRGWHRALIVMLLAGLGVAIARTGSRGAFLSLIVSAVLMLVLTRGVTVLRKMGFASAVIIALFVAAPPGYMKQMSTLVNPKDDYNWSSPTGRRQVTERGFGYMMSYPLFGVGMSNFEKAECTISPRFKTEARDIGIRCTPPHNTWIQVGAELGVPGLIAWCVLIFLPAFKLLALSRRLPLSWRSGDFEQRVLFACANALPISLIGFAVGSTFLTFAWIDIPYLLVIFAGSTWLLARRRMAADRANGPVHGGSAAPLRRMRSQPRA